jgi:hypothetical protein
MTNKRTNDLTRCSFEHLSVLGVFLENLAPELWHESVETHRDLVGAPFVEKNYLVWIILDVFEALHDLEARDAVQLRDRSTTQQGPKARDDLRCEGGVGLSDSLTELNRHVDRQPASPNEPSDHLETPVDRDVMFPTGAA